MPVGLSFPSWPRTESGARRMKRTKARTPWVTVREKEFFITCSSISRIDYGPIVSRVLIVDHPELETQLLISIMQRDLVDTGLVAGAELETNRSVRGDDEVLTRWDNRAAIQGDYGDRSSGRGRR